MVNDKLGQIVKEEWQKVRKRFYYPQLPQPRLVGKSEGGGSFNFLNLETTIEEPYIKSLRGKGIASTDKESDTLAINECLSHELTHYVKFPGSVLNVLRLQKAGQGIADDNTISRLRRDYTENQTNLDLILNQKHPATVSIARELNKQNKYPGSLGKLHYGLYQEVSNQNFGVELNQEEKGLIKKLKDIDYTKKDEEIYNFRKFAQILKDYKPPKNKNKKGGKNQNQNGLEGFSDNQIREGLKQFAQECSSPQEYEEIVKQVLSEGKGQAVGKQAGLGKGVTQLADNFYTALAEKYVIPIRKKSIHKNGSLYPYSHTSFEIGDSITDVDAFSTPGILPGITKKWVRKEGEVYGDNESVPDSFLIIDNSPSMFMPNWSEVQSSSERIYQHIVGATAISNAYLFNDSRVAVYSFGSSDYLLNSTKDREAVHRELRRYSSDGGTTFNSKFLEKVLKDSKGKYDVSVVSDMDIRNFKNFISSVLDIPQTHRIHLLYTENNDYVKKLRKSFGNRENVVILPLTCESDIQKITMGELEKSIH